MYRFSRSSNQSGFRGVGPLSNDTIARYAPSVLAATPHASRGERYTFIPTLTVLDGLRREGFEPFEVRQTQVRDTDRSATTKHLVRLRHASQIEQTGRTEVPEIVLINSHDGTSSYQILAGIFRFVCSNGLIAGDICHDVRVRHTGNVVNDVIEGSYRVLENLTQVTARIDTYKAIGLDLPEQEALAKAAVGLRWDEGQAPIAPVALLGVNRSADRPQDLWTVFNRIQENLLTGGVRGWSATRQRWQRTRAVGGVNENVRLNRALWTLADELAKHKQGEAVAV